METILFFNTLMFLGIATEYVYSMYKKDGVYSKEGTIVNSINGIILIFTSRKFTLLYIGLFLALYTFFTKTSLPFTFNTLSFLCTLVLVDFMYYIFHNVHHRFAFFWMFHHVHHGDNKFNLSTAYRISIIEQSYQFLFFLPLLFIGINPILIAIAFAVISIHQYFCHSTYIRFPHFISYILVTPQSHRIHHDQNIKYQNSNFGGMFSLWDFLFKTTQYNITLDKPGIKGYSSQNILHTYLDPIKKYLKK